MDCAFFGFHILADYIYIPMLLLRHFVSFLWVFSRFLVSSPGASGPDPASALKMVPSVDIEKCDDSI